MKIIVTGSEGTIGKKLVPWLEKQGHSIIRVSKSLGHDLTNELFVSDLFMNEATKADALVNLFGANPNFFEGDFWDLSLMEFERIMNTNVVSLFHVCREFALYQEKCSIVNFSSIYGVVSPDPKIYEPGYIKNIGYSVSKAAVIQLTKCLAVHLKSEQRINCIVCGGVENNQSDEFKKNYSAKVPLGRMMEAEELGGLVEYLCSDKSSYCTGGVFTIDGGYTIL